MKTVISLPDGLFHAVERLARLSKRHRNELYADALREYVARHSPDGVTDSLNRVLKHINDFLEDYRFIAAAARQVLTNAE